MVAQSKMCRQHFSLAKGWEQLGNDIEDWIADLQDLIFTLKDVLGDGNYMDWMEHLKRFYEKFEAYIKSEGVLNEKIMISNTLKAIEVCGGKYWLWAQYEIEHPNTINDALYFLEFLTRRAKKQDAGTEKLYQYMWENTTQNDNMGRFFERSGRTTDLVWELFNNGGKEYLQHCLDHDIGSLNKVINIMYEKLSDSMNMCFTEWAQNKTNRLAWIKYHKILNEYDIVEPEPSIEYCGKMWKYPIPPQYVQ